MDNKNDNNKINEETPKVVTPGTDNTVNSTPVNNEPKVVEDSNTNEVNQQTVNTSNNQDNTVPTSVKLEENTTGKKKKGHPVFLVLLMLFLFAFVFFLPNITDFVTDYMNKKTGVNELKSGTMSCTFRNSTDNLDYINVLSDKY